MGKYLYDMIVIGGGGGGLTSSKLARGFGKKVALIEKEKLGGECTWTGCVPSKSLIKAAQAAHYVRRLRDFGLVYGEHKLDTSAVMQFVRNQVHQVYQTHTPDMLRQEGIDLFFGLCSFVDEHTVIVNNQRLTAAQFIIATGSHPFAPPVDGLDQVPYLTNQTFFKRDTLPESLIIVGGGAVGAELASALNRLGVTVTLLEQRDRMLMQEDEELVQMLQDILIKEGVQLYTSIALQQVSKSRSGVVAIVRDPQGFEKQIAAEQVLVAAGRRPNIEGLALEKAGVVYEEKKIVVDQYMRTSMPHIYAVGDVVGPYLFSHMAWHQAVVAVRNACIPIFKKRMNYDHVLWVTFTAPELAAAGMTERQAREKYGDTIKVYKRGYNAFDRGVIDLSLDGLGKFICDKKGRLLGAHLLGARTGELIHQIQVGRIYGVRFSDFASMIHAYPTYSELIWHASKMAYIDRIRNSFFVQWYTRLFGRNKNK